MIRSLKYLFAISLTKIKTKQTNNTCKWQFELTCLMPLPSQIPLKDHRVVLGREKSLEHWHKIRKDGIKGLEFWRSWHDLVQVKMTGQILTSTIQRWRRKAVQEASGWDSPWRPRKFSKLTRKQMGLRGSWWAANERSLATLPVPDVELLATQKHLGREGPPPSAPLLSEVSNEWESSEFLRQKCLLCFPLQIFPSWIDSLSKENKTPK